MRAEASITGTIPKGISEGDAWRVIHAADTVFDGASSLEIFIDGDPPYLVVRGHSDCSEVITIEPADFRLADHELERILQEREEGRWRVEPARGRFDFKKPPKDI